MNEWKKEIISDRSRCNMEFERNRNHFSAVWLWCDDKLGCRQLPCQLQTKTSQYRP